MEALMRVMAAKKREVSAVQAEKSGKKDKYMRRGEVEALLAQKEADEKRAADSRREREASLSPVAPSKRRRTDKHSDASGERASLSEGQDTLQTDSTQTTEQAAEEEPVLSWTDLRKRLRELGEPITLFGEDTKARMVRLRRAELDAATKKEDGLGGGRDRFVGDEDGGDGQKDEDDQDKGDAAGRDELSHEEVDDSDEDKMVYRFFKTMLHSWEKDLSDRPDHVKRTAQGKVATKTMKQCKDYIRPLFKLCKKREVPSDILPNLVEIVKYCRQGEFVRANDSYIRLAIGNAAWPIGVTMVGIHERTGREKINANKQAHVMNNEAQRKYLTSVKRLISYAQSISNVLPSKKVS